MSATRNSSEIPQSATGNTRIQLFERLATSGVAEGNPENQKWHRPVLLLGSIAAVPSLTGTGTVEGLDPGWMYWIHRASTDGLQWGRDVVFTYGPLGWLSQPNSDFRVHLAISSMVLVLVHYLAISTLQRWLKVSPTAAVVIALGAFACAPAYPERFLCVVGLLCLRPRSMVERPVLYDIGTSAGIALISLIKFGNGLISLVLVLGAVSYDALFPYRREALRSAARITILVPAFLGLGFVAIGQSLANLWDFVQSSFEIAVGFSASMQLASPELRWTILLLPFLGFATLCSARNLRNTLLLGLAFFFGIRLGFTRHDLGHYQTSLSLPLFVGLGLAADSIATKATLPSIRGKVGKEQPGKVFIAPLVFALSSFAVFQGTPLAWLGAPFRPLVTNLELLTNSRGSVSPSPSENFPSLPELQSLLTDHRVQSNVTVGIEPWDLGLHKALGIRSPRQAPVFQRYSAYTAKLDELNATFMASAQAPKILLYRMKAEIDQRIASFEAPRTMFEIARQYRFMEASKSGAWALLRRRTPSELEGSQICTPSILLTAKPLPIQEKVGSLFWPPSPSQVLANGKSRRLTGASFSTPLLPYSDLPGLPGTVDIRAKNSATTNAIVREGPELCLPVNR